MAEQSRARTGRAPGPSGHDNSTTAGQLAARTWLTSRGLTSSGVLQRWHVDILLDVVDQMARPQFDDRVDTRFRIEIYSEEWGFMFCHGSRSSRIRVTHTASVHGRDDYALLEATPPLKDLGALLRFIEHGNRLRFRRRNAVVRTNLANADGAIRRWVESL